MPTTGNVGRPRLGIRKRDTHVGVRLNQVEAAMLDQVRGSTPRGVFLRELSQAEYLRRSQSDQPK